MREIHVASDLLPNDPKYSFHDFTAQVLHLVSPRKLRTTLTVPHSWDLDRLDSASGMEPMRLFPAASRRPPAVRTSSTSHAQRHTQRQGQRSSTNPHPSARWVCLAWNRLSQTDSTCEHSNWPSPAGVWLRPSPGSLSEPILSSCTGRNCQCWGRRQ